MRDAAATARRPGWWRFLLALFAYVAFGYLPAATAFTPVGPAFLLVAAVTVACVIVGVALGARPSVPALAVATVGGLLVAPMAGVPDSYRLLVIGWTVVLGASFGMVSLLSPGQPFLSRALSTIALAFIVGVVGAAMFGTGIDRVKAAVYSEATRRADMLDLQGQRYFATEKWRDTEARQPQLATMRASYEEWVHALPARTVFLLPALLALQSLAALALGWELFHRLSRDRIGPPLGRLRDFRFNDQLVWAVAVGLTIFVLPEFAEGRSAGLNILVFFGALFALRGLGVLSSLRRGGLLVAMLVMLLVFAWPLAIALALILGLADIWLDVRRRASAVK